MAKGDERTVAADPDAVRADVASWPTGRLLAVAARVLEHRFDAILAERGLSHAGLIALHHLVGAPYAQRPLAALCRVTEQTMSRTLDRLRREGYVLTRPDDRDRRRMVVEITDAGRAEVDAARRAERESEVLLGAVDDYEGFRMQLVKIVVALDQFAQQAE